MGAEETVFAFNFIQQESCRLDHFLVGCRPELSRSRLQALIRTGRVKVNGELVRASRRLRPGDRIELVEPAPVALALKPQELPLEIVYEDHCLVVVNKPAGLVVHPAAGHPDGTLVNALLHHCRDLAGIGGVCRPGIVHRLDQDTTGLLVVAKDDVTHQALAEQFREHSIAREYTALVYGRLLPLSGFFDGPIGRHPRQRKKMAVVPGGKPARTNYQVLSFYPGADCSLLRLRLETGRTHQIRVHLSQAGHPLVGDPLYGRKGARRTPSDPRAAARLAAFPRQALHAGRLGFVHPATKRFLAFTRPLPSDFKRLLDDIAGGEEASLRGRG